ncbi:ornithine decarboxylase antizyme short [Lentinula edodes]|uniref:Ornithine decarboxylase antizyme short n=1 Tax=Lentinula edodes TaxID=5353 RepID=A0A1Q3E3G7_LENED|nr:ornithine decarboxylase antizyme short [Lentinula edodes]
MDPIAVHGHEWSRFEHHKGMGVAKRSPDIWPGLSRRLPIQGALEIVWQCLRFAPQLQTPKISSPQSSWHMSLKNNSNLSNQRFSLCPTNGRQTVGDGAVTLDTPSVLAVCQMQGTDDMYYYSTTFSGGPGWRF